MLSVVVLCVTIFVVMQNVIMLSVVAPIVLQCCKLVRLSDLTTSTLVYHFGAWQEAYTMGGLHLMPCGKY
jgi:hypothetical protein